jgi:hypothetical protein
MTTWTKKDIKPVYTKLGRLFDFRPQIASFAHIANNVLKMGKTDDNKLKGNKHPEKNF